MNLVFYLTHFAKKVKKLLLYFMLIEILSIKKTFIFYFKKNN